jgi:S-DNA-T family DNA segregation ATPase FtsK/SpoIIIE
MAADTVEKEKRRAPAPIQKSGEQQPCGNGKRVQEISGVIAVISGLYLAVALFSYNKWDPSLLTFSLTGVKNYGGIVGSYSADIILSLVGISGYLIPLFLVFYGIGKIMGKERNLVHVAGALLFLPSLSTFLHPIAKTISLKIDPPGGIAGLLMSNLFVSILSVAGAYILSIALIAVSLILISPVSLFDYFVAMKRRKMPVEKAALQGSALEEAEIIIHAPPPIPVSLESAPLPRKQVKEKPGKEASAGEVRDKGQAVAEPGGEGGYLLPSLEFLKEGEDTTGPAKEELSGAAQGLEKKLADFGVSGKIKQAYPGPVVTMYEFEPAAGVKINRIVSLSDDLALSLRAPSIRVYPIAGKAALGIEVPNRQRATVYLKGVFSSEQFRRSSSLLTLALGKDIFGTPVVADLAKMPHLLVAGATGSGKSVSVNAMIMSILYKATPDEVKMLMVDPKLLELSSYADIPHLISPVITNPKEASEALRKVVFEMERRYMLLAEKGARSIDTYNRQVSPEQKLPYIVVFIDELADLMLTAPSDVETAIARLAQMARASGIHLILATQRPSVDVITGLIKANFPARISFQVTSKIDSRTILDGQGAEQLLGMGDMLFMVPGVKIMRIHGAYVSDTEVRTVTDFVKSQRRPDFTPFQSIVVVDEKKKGDEGVDDRDDMYHQVLEFAEGAGEVSISSIQRRFKIGYNRAANIMELLAEDGVVGPPKGAGKPRDFLGRR